MANLGTRNTQYPIWQAVFAGSSPVTGSAPTDATDGLPTAGLSRATIYLSADSGVTLSGAGSLLAYEFTAALDPKTTTGRWARVPSQDIAITTSGVRDLEVGVVDLAPWRNEAHLSTAIVYIPSGITNSTGSAGVTITIVGTTAALISNGSL